LHVTITALSEGT